MNRLEWKERAVLDDIYKALRNKGYSGEPEIKYGNVMDDYWITVRINGSVRFDGEAQFEQINAFYDVLGKINKL